MRKADADAPKPAEASDVRRGVTFGLAARVGPAVVLASMLGLAGVPVGYEPDGALDGLAALLTSRRLHRAGSAAERCLLGVQKRKSRLCRGMSALPNERTSSGCLGVS